MQRKTNKVEGLINLFDSVQSWVNQAQNTDEGHATNNLSSKQLMSV